MLTQFRQSFCLYPHETISPQKIKATANIFNQRLAEASSYAKAFISGTVDEIIIKDDVVCLSGNSQAIAILSPTTPPSTL